MKKIFIFCMVALVAMCSLNSCSDDCNHDFIEQDYSKALVGTWTCLNEDLAEALVFKADGSFISSGVADGQYWEDINATWELKNNKLTLSNEEYKSELLLEIIPGKSMALVDVENNIRNTFDYCENDLSDEIVGMWVCNDGPANKENDMLIQTFNEDGSTIMTGDADELLLNDKSTNYKVCGDMLFLKMNKENVSYVPFRMSYSPNGTILGDVMTLTLGSNYANIASTATWLRIHQDLNLTNKSYDYSNLYLSNVKGKDQDINFWGYTMNLANMDGSGIDKMLKSILFHIEFPDAKTLSYTYTLGTNKETYSAPIEVEGNKFTVKMSQRVPTLKDVVFYAYQDANDSQMHLYMHRDAFVNFYTNMQAMLMIVENPAFDITNAEAIDAIYNNISDAVESINLSIVMK